MSIKLFSIEVLKHPGLKYTLSFQVLKVNLLFQNLKDQQAAPRQLSARHRTFSPRPVLPRMFPKFNFSQAMCQVRTPWKVGGAREAAAFLWAPHHGTHDALASNFGSMDTRQCSPSCQADKRPLSFWKGKEITAVCLPWSGCPSLTTTPPPPHGPRRGQVCSVPQRLA